MGSLTEGKIEGRGRDFYPNPTLQMILINTLIVGFMGAVAPGPVLVLIVKAQKTSLPAFPLPLQPRDRMAVIYSVLSLSIAAR